MGENPAVAGGGGGCRGTGCGDRRDDQKPTFVDWVLKFLWYLAPKPSRQNKYDRSLAAKEKAKHIFFQCTLKAAHYTLSLVAHVRRPIVAAHHILRGNPSRCKERHLVWQVKERSVPYHLERCFHKANQSSPVSTVQTPFLPVITQDEICDSIASCTCTGLSQRYLRNIASL